MPPEIRLPQVTLSPTPPPAGVEVLLVAGGRKPLIPWLLEAAEGRIIWAVDRGVDICMEAGLLPALVLGDADSASKRLLKAAKSRGVEALLVSREKNETDLQIALRTLVERFYRPSAILTGCWGGRFDHTWSNVMSVVGALRNGLGFAAMVDHRELLTVVRGGGAMTLSHEKAPCAVSLLALSERCSGVSISGVHWPLERTMLEKDVPYAISNRACEGMPTCSRLEEGDLGLYVSWWER